MDEQLIKEILEGNRNLIRAALEEVEKAREEYGIASEEYALALGAYVNTLNILGVNPYKECEDAMLR